MSPRTESKRESLATMALPKAPALNQDCSVLNRVAELDRRELNMVMQYLLAVVCQAPVEGRVYTHNGHPLMMLALADVPAKYWQLALTDLLNPGPSILLSQLKQQPGDRGHRKSSIEAGFLENLTYLYREPPAAELAFRSEYLGTRWIDQQMHTCYNFSPRDCHLRELPQDRADFAAHVVITQSERLASDNPAVTSSGRDAPPFTTWQLYQDFLIALLPRVSASVAQTILEKPLQNWGDTQISEIASDMQISKEVKLTALRNFRRMGSNKGYTVSLDSEIDTVNWIEKRQSKLTALVGQMNGS